MPAPPPPPGSVAAAVLARHGASPQPSSRAVAAVTRSVLDVLHGAGLPPSPAALFAACMSALERGEARAEGEVGVGRVAARRPRMQRAGGRARAPRAVPAGLLSRTRALGGRRTPAGAASGRAHGAAAAGRPRAPCSFLQVLAAMLTLLDAVLDKVPPAVLGSKFSQAAAVLAAASDAAAADPAAARAVAGCLASALARGAGAGADVDWPMAAPLMTRLLAGCLDARPKPRRRASDGLAAALRGLAGTPAAPHAADAVVRLAADVLPGPEAAAAAAAAAPAKARAGAAEAAARATADALHLLGALRTALPLLPPPACARGAGLVLPLAGAPHPLLARHAADALSSLFAAHPSPLPPAALDDLVRGLASMPAAFDARDVGVAAAGAGALRAGVGALAAADAGAAAAALPAAVAAIAPLLAAESEGVRSAGAAALSGCLADAGGAPGSLSPTGPRAPAPPAARTAAALAAALAPAAREGWATALPCAAAFFDAVGQDGAAAAAPLLDRVGALAAAAAAASDRGEPAPDFAAPAAAALGSALRSLGPAAVLETLPLGLDAALDGAPGARAAARPWLAPLLRTHVRGGSLAFWCTDLLPIARSMGGRAAAAAAAGDADLAARVRALEAQLWAALPAFASWALDAGAALR